MRRSIRSRAMAMSRNQMIRAVSAADVVVVNPTHYAVALKYDAGKGAPEVVAKGAGVIAQGIRAQAETHGVPIVHEAVLYPDALQGVRDRPAHPGEPVRGSRPPPGLRLRPAGQGAGPTATTSCQNPSLL